MKALLGKMHAGLVFDRRVRVLAETVGDMIPQGASVIDVGCGDGTIASLIQAKRSDVVIDGIDVMVRPQTKIPVTMFDGTTLPFADKSSDVVLFVDVLHHTLEPSRLVREAARVARKAVIIKDHIADSGTDRTILSFMDWVGNAPHGVVLPYNYLSRRGWDALFLDEELTPVQTVGSLPLYPWPLNAVFGRGLHFITQLAPRVEYEQAA